MASIKSQQRENFPAPKGPPPTHLKPLKMGMSKREREENVRMNQLRARQPYLSVEQTCEYRHSVYQTISVRILKAGYHQTYAELFHLVRQQHRARDKAGPETVLWNITPLDQQKEKMAKLEEYLTKGESLEREGEFVKAYKCYYDLAQFFTADPNDKWLADYYYEKCLNVSIHIDSDDGLCLAEAHLNLGLTLEANNDFHGANEHFEEFYKLTFGKEWMLKDGSQMMHSASCEHLARIYTSLAEECKKTSAQDSLTHLQKAHEMAKESGNRKLEGQCAYRLGQGFDRVGKPDTALHFLRGFYELAKAINDHESMGCACEEMAKAFEKQGKIQESLRFLVEFVEVTEKSNQRSLYGRACRAIGNVYNRMARFEEAADYFKKALATARELKEVPSTYQSRIQYGIASGNRMSPANAQHAELATRTAVARLLEWKNVRSNVMEGAVDDACEDTLAARRPKRRAAVVKVEAAPTTATLDDDSAM